MHEPNPAPSKPRRHWLSFSLRGMLLLTLFIGGMSAYLGKDVIQGMEEQAIVDQVNKGRALVRYAHEYGNDQGQLPGNPLLRSIFGQNYLARVHKLRVDDPIGEETIQQFTKLRELDALQLGPETLSDRSIDAIARIPKLRALILNETQITPEQLRRLAKSDSLRQLVLDRHTSADAHLAQLKHFPHLESVTLWDLSPAGIGIPTTDAGIQSFAHVDSLQHLSITLAPHITDTSLDHISKLPNLRLLKITDAPITSQGVALLVRMTSLESLRINTQLPPQPIDGDRIKQRKSLDNLAQLFLTGKAFDDQFLEAISPLPKLEILGLTVTSITDAGLAPLKDCPALASIHESGNTFTPQGMAAIGFFNNPNVPGSGYYERKRTTTP